MITRPASWLAGLASILAWCVPAFAQIPPAGQPPLTVTSTPPGLTLHLVGDLEVTGPSPLELPPTFEGRFSLTAEGNGVARTQGIFRFTADGTPPRMLSEPAGLSAGLILRSLNYPGVPNITSQRGERGWPMAIGATGALGLAIDAHVRYHEDLDTPGPIAGFDIRQERRERNTWLIYGGAIWGLSALDYWMRPRFQTHGAIPGRLSIEAPPLNRGKVVARSLFVPGAGQAYSNHRTRSSLWLMGVLVAGAGYAVAETRIAKEERDIDRGLYLAGQNPAEGPVLLEEVQSSKEDRAKADDLRRRFGYAGLGIVALNVLDAMTLSLHHQAGSQEIPVSATIGPEGPRLTLRLRY